MPFSLAANAENVEKWYISCDYGTVNPTSMGLWGRKDGIWYRVKEFYFDSRSRMRQMTDEEYANLLLTLCHQTDKMMCAYVEKLEQRFVTEGGIKERMYAARTGYRKSQDEYIKRLEEENRFLRAENERLTKILEEIGGARKS